MNIAKNTLSIVTGATGGLGKEISKSILVQNGKLVFVARDEQKINLFGKELDELESGSFYTIKANLSSNDDLTQIEADLTEILQKNVEVEEVFLFNNASTIDPIAVIEDVSFVSFPRLKLTKGEIVKKQSLDFTSIRCFLKRISENS